MGPGRRYDPALGRFLSADTVVPQAANPQALNRYAYVLNNPLRYTDPSGHSIPVYERGDNNVYYHPQTGMYSYDVSPQVRWTGAGTTPAEVAIVEGGGRGDNGEGLVMAASAPFIGVGMLAGFDLAYIGASYTASKLTPLIPAGWEAVKSWWDKVTGPSSEGQGQTIGRVFWSGGKVAQKAAEAWAKVNNATTLEMTKAGQRLQETTKGLDWLTQARPQWVAASQEFAAGATGEVHVFHNSGGVSLQSIWATVEYQALMLNPNVTQIIYHVVMPNGSDVIVP